MRLRIVVVALAALALVPASSAADGVRVTHVDAHAYPRLAVTVSAPPQAAPRLREDGDPVAGLHAENLGRAKSVVVAVDLSRSMRGKPLADALAAARSFVRSKSSGDRVAIVGFGEKASAYTRFTSATIDADIALRELAVDKRQGTALNDAVVLGSRMLGREPLLGRVLVVVTDGTDVSSRASEDAAVDAARRAGASVYAVGIASDQFSPASLRRLSEETGGSYRDAASSAELASAYRSIASELARTWRLTYVTAARPGEDVRLTASAHGAGTDERTVTVPGRAAPAPEQPSTLLPATAYDSGWSSFAVGAMVGFLVLLSLVFVAAARRSAWLKGRLAPHVAPAVGARKRAEHRDRFTMGTSVMAATERAFGHLNWWAKLHRALERADLPLRTVEFLYIVIGASFLVALVAAVAGAPTLLILAGFAVGAAVPLGYLTLRTRKRLKAFENQLPDILLTMAASLKAGHSFKQGLQTVVDEGQPPASKEFQRVLAETQLGRAMEDALADMAERVNSKNLRFVLNAVTIQSQVGGSLASLFDMVAETVRQRQQFIRKVRGLTAMGRASAYVLVGLPFFTAGVITLLNREFMRPLYFTSTGHKLMILAVGMIGFGSILLRKIVSFKG
ncbi:MAG TPA: type II secretion system F family protein [Gaiellaceae bacterium]|nr:type II secretion system F family protein [Gaiellaceae bacterium]